jgi:uncharacterized protein YpmS
MKAFLISVFFVAAIIAGYFYLSAEHEKAMAREQEQREQQIMQKQQQFQSQTSDLGKQMQQDLENRMEPVDSGDN